MLRRIILCALLWLMGMFVQAQVFTLPGANAPYDKSSSMVLRTDGRLIVTNRLTNTVAIIRPQTGALELELPVGAMPTHLTLTADEQRALVVNRADGTLTVLNLRTPGVEATYDVGALPAGVVSAGDVAYVAVRGAVVALDLASGQIVQRFDATQNPGALTLWGDYLLLADVWDDVITLYDRTTGSATSIVTGGTHTHQIEIDTANARAYVPQMLVNTDAPFDARFIPIINIIDLASLQVLHPQRINLLVADQAVHMPFAALLRGNHTLYVAHAGSDAASVLNLRTRQAIGHFVTGANPRAILLSRGNLELYTHDVIDHTITVRGTRFYELQDTIPTTRQSVTPDVQIGARLFHSASDPRMSANDAVSCAACHFNGTSDERRWFGAVTPRLRDPQNITVNAHIATLQAGYGLENPSFTHDGLMAYIRRLQGFSPD